MIRYIIRHWIRDFCMVFFTTSNGVMWRRGGRFRWAYLWAEYGRDLDKEAQEIKRMNEGDPNA